MFLFVIQLQAQQTAATSNNEVDKLRLKTAYLLGTGIVFTATGTALTAAGVVNMKMGITHDGLIGSPSETDHRPAGRAFLAFGVPILAGGVTMFALGVYYHKQLMVKRNAMNVTVGSLESGNTGVALNF